jgi:stringent starvation protein B
MAASPPLSKQEQLHKLLERGSVFVHLDPRREGVVVPPWLTKKPQLVLQLGLNFPIPIRDLEIDEAGVRCTLSFNRAPFYCVLPWHAVYALVAEDGQVTVWPSELPSELVPQAESAVRRNEPRARRGKSLPPPRISLVPDAEDGAQPAPGPVPTDPVPCTLTPLHERAAAMTTPHEGAQQPEARSPSTKPPGRPARERPPYLRLIK